MKAPSTMQFDEYRENPNVSAWVMAHAGSGKTYALVRRVIALLLNGADPRTIWCVTYTNIAAAEMRTRVASKLAELQALEDDDALAAALSNYLEYTVDSLQVARLRELRMRMQRPDAQVRCTTMHGLCQVILRIFALELGLSPHLSALDEEGQRELLTQACNQMLTKAMEPNHPAAQALIHALSVAGSYDALEEYLHAMIARHGVWLTSAENFADAKTRMQAFLQAHALDEVVAEAALIQQAREQTPSEMESIASLLLGGTKTDIETAQAMLSWLKADGAQAVQLWETYLDVFVTKTGDRAPRAKLCTKILDAKSVLGKAFYAEQVRIVNVRNRIAAQACAQDSAHMMTLFLAAHAAYGELKARSDALDFDDMIFYVKKLFSNPESLGYAMSKLDWRVEHILLDEAQDTSPDQWYILSALVEDLCNAPSNVSTGEKTVFVVGDTKQSIYSFQGAAPWMMQDRKSYFEQMFSGNGRGFVTGKLSKARRSVPKILQFVDAIGDHAAVRAGWMENKEPHIPERTGAPGQIVCWAATEHDEKTERTPYAIAHDYASSSRAVAKLADAIADNIAECLQSNMVLTATNKPLAAGDIMVLVRKRGALVPALLRTLQARNIPVAGADRVRLSEHVFTRDILALIAWCFQPEDDVALATVLRSPIGKFSEEALFALTHGRKASVWQALCDTSQYEALCEELTAYRDARGSAIYGFLLMVLHGYNHHASYRARLGDSVIAVIDELLDYTNTLDGSPEGQLLAFMARMQRSHMDIKRGGDAQDTVRILTVHGAKGLEAPMVILADMADASGTSKEKIFAIKHKQAELPLVALSAQAKLAPVFIAAKATRKQLLEEEYYRQFYVAITRARDVLYLCTAKGKNALSQHSWYHIARTTLKALPDVQVMDDGRIVWQDAGVFASAPSATPPKKAPEESLPDWLFERHVPVDALPEPALLTPSRLVADEPAEHADARITAKPNNAVPMDDARVFGTALHALLAWATPDLPDAQIIQALEAEGASARDAAYGLGCMKRLWQQPDIAQLLHAAHVSEQEVSGEVCVNNTIYRAYGIMDRLVMLPDARVIVDFKTTLMPPASDALPDSYLAQLGLYHALLSSRTQDVPVRCALLWTHHGRIDWLDNEAMHAALTRVTKNLATKTAGLLDAKTLAA